jgi:hypothetical protein
LFTVPDSVVGFPKKNNGIEEGFQAESAFIGLFFAVKEDRLRTAALLFGVTQNFKEN